MESIKTENYAKGNEKVSESETAAANKSPDKVFGIWLNTPMQRADTLRKKGDRTLICGATASGKTTLLAVLTPSGRVRMYLTMRQASGKGSVEPCSITVTNSDELDPDTLYYIADLKKVTKDDADDELYFLAAVLYAAAKACVENNLNKDVYFNKLRRAFEYQLTSPTNHSLEYKLKSSSMGSTNIIEEFKDILDVIESISPDEMISLYNLANAATTKKGQQKLRIFREKCLESASLKDDMNRFYNTVLDRLNRDAENFGALLEKSGAEFVKTNQSGSADNVSYCGRRFGLAMNSKTPEDVAKLLLDSESSSKETLLDDIALVFRGNDSLFELDSDTDLLTVSVENAPNGETKKIKNLNFIDTMGLFHKPSADIDEEASRSIDMMRQYKCSRMLMVVNADVTDTVKKHHEVIREILNSTNFRFDMHLMFTHYDKYLRSFAVTKSEDIFARQVVDWKKCLNDAMDKEKELVDSFNSITEQRKASSKDNRKIPEIVNPIYRAALPTDGAAGDALEARSITYPIAIKTFIKTMLHRKLQLGKKLIISRSALHVNVNSTTFSNKVGINNLFNELAAVNNRSNRLYAQTVRAVNRHWQVYGDMFASKVNPENNGDFTNFKSTFVQFIRDAAKTIVGNNITIANGACVNSDDDGEFENKLRGYLRDNIGREIAKIIADDCYDKGFVTRTGFVYQYDRLYDELDYLIAHYFNASTIVPGKELQEAISKALKKCVDDYVDLYCIEQL